MKSFFAKVTRGIKTKRTPRALCDCQDYSAAVPAAPTIQYLREFVREKHFGGKPPASSPYEVERRELVLRHTLFDLLYRCGAEGRCTCEGSPRCRFPGCFTMRPVTKGAEILAERLTYEVDDAPSAEIRSLVSLATEERLEEAIKGIKELASRQIRTAVGGRSADKALREDAELGLEFSEGEAKTGPDSAFFGANPLHTQEELREEVIALYRWRAALLVNLRGDEQAVNSLLNLANALKVEHRTSVYSAATSWAALNDMEIIYYRSLLKQFGSFPLADHFANERPLLLARVFEAMANDDYHTQLCTHIVFSKEVTATVSRAQSAQIHRDITEDPMTSLCLPLSMPYYRFKVSDAFWGHFYNLLCMPPIPPPTEEELAKQSAAPVADLGLTPNHILDAVGRSMMLHHLVIFADTREKEIDKGVVADRLNRFKSAGVPITTSDYDHVLDNREMSVAVGRMRQLLVVVKTYEEGERQRLAGTAAEAAAPLPTGESPSPSEATAAAEPPASKPSQ